MQSVNSTVHVIEEPGASTSQEPSSPDTAPKSGQQQAHCPKQKVHTDVLFIILIILELLMYLVEERPFLSRLFFFLVVAILLGKFVSWIFSTCCQKPINNENSNLSFIDIQQSSMSPPQSSVDNINVFTNQPVSDLSSPVASEGRASSSDLPPYHIALSLPQPSYSSLTLPDYAETPPPTYDKVLESHASSH